MRSTTSASNIHRRVRCPGSHFAEQGLSEPPESEYAAEGSLLHSAMELPLKPGIKLTEHQAWLVNETRELFAEVHATAAANFPSLGEFTEGWEREMMLHVGIRLVLTGHCDHWRYYAAEKLLVIIDAKYGFIEVDAAPLNVQLRAYAVMGAQEWDVETCIVAIAQPRAHMIEGAETMTIAQYSRADLALATKQIIAWEKGWLDPNAQRSPSEAACRFCKAKPQCPEHRARREIVATAPPVLGDLADADFAHLYESWKLATRDDVAAAIAAEARTRITEGRMPGYALKENAPRRGITDQVKAAALLRDTLGFDAAEIAACSKITLGKEGAERVLRQKTGAKAGAAKEQLNNALAAVIELNTPTPSVVRVTVADSDQPPDRQLNGPNSTTP